MIKKSASRNQRSKGVKTKHVVQILLLLAICFWLIYQIKCSHDRKREINEKDSKTSVKEDIDVGLKLGRKDLRVKHREEDDEEESKDEDEGNQGERQDVEVDEYEQRREVEKNEEQEHEGGKKDESDVDTGDNHEDDEGREEEDGNKMDEVEDEKVTDDGEINEVDEEGAEREIDREEEFLDDDKEKQEESVDDEGEETNGGDREEQVGDENISEDKDHDEISQNAHVAREVQYQADDASSAVAHDTHADNGNADLESNNSGMGSNSSMSDSHNLESSREKEKEKEREVTTVDMAEAKSNVSETDNQVNNASVMGSTEFTGSVSNVTENVLNLPQSLPLAVPDMGGSEASLKQANSVEMDSAFTSEKIKNDSTVTYNNNQPDTTPSTSNVGSVKTFDQSNNQAKAKADDVAGSDKKEELDGSLRTPSSGEGKDNSIQMQLSDNQDGGGSQTQ